MPVFSEEQKRIALLLLHEAKTAEQLSNQLNIPYDRLMENLRQMLKMDVMVKEGYPTKYRLKEHIAEKAKERRKMAEEDKNRIRLRAVIEVQAIEENLLKKQLKEIIKAIREEKEFNIYDIEEAKIEKHEEAYSSYLQVELSVKDLNSLLRLMFLYGPSSVEVLRPKKLEVELSELQDALITISDIVHSYSDYIAEKLNREELEAFTKKLYG